MFKQENLLRKVINEIAVSFHQDFKFGIILKVKLLSMLIKCVYITTTTPDL